MSQILKNKHIELHVDLPHENYNSSRFDWTGKIVKIRFKNIEISGVERTNCQNFNKYGKGFYNEFGIDSALRFKETKIGDWFHKIGVGLLKKESEQYLFSENYEIRPAKFNYSIEENKLTILCESETINAYSYLLKKEIHLVNDGFKIDYFLKNTGHKRIISNEYMHNFICINNNLIDENYVLKLPFQLNSKLFNEIVNPEQKVSISENKFNFKNNINEQFFFSNLSGGQNVDASWELINQKDNIGIIEITSFRTTKINLWGWKHVISPELFFDINIAPGESESWTRTFKIFNLS